MDNIIWKPVNIKNVIEGFVVSQYGDVKLNGSEYCISKYHSTNGRDYVMLIDIMHNPRLYPLDYVLALSFIKIPENLKNCKIIVKHIDNDITNNDISNLQWVENIIIWKPVIFQNIISNRYMVSNNGILFDNISNNIVNYNFDKDGYFRCSMMTTNGAKDFRVHRIIAYCFLKDTINCYDFSKFDVNHINSIKTDNDIMNLEIVPHQLNMRHTYDFGSNSRTISGIVAEDVCKSIIKYDGNVKNVYNDLKQKYPYITKDIIYKILYKESWTDISDKYFKESYAVKRLDESIVNEVCRIICETNGDVDKTIETLYKLNINVSKSYIRSIKCKKVLMKISDKYFDKDRFREYLTVEEVERIAETLIKYKGDDRIVFKVVEELKPEIPLINYKRVLDIKNKGHWANITDKYFKLGDV